MISYYFYHRLRDRIEREANTHHYDRAIIKPHMSDAQISRQLKDTAPSWARAIKPLVGLGIDLVLLWIGWRVIGYFLAF
jgi:hypothetical protein